MHRRRFLQGAAAAGLAGLTGSARVAAEVPAQGAKLRGVNLGGWLALEKWIAPDAFAGTEAPDEYTLSETLGARAADRLKRHRESWITADDFKWIAARGLNAVRIPVGYGVLEPNPPYVPAADTLDWAFR
ncbi:MAG TPA: twin-arginine translocation signal domain-containing protein, partial [Chthonomonadaceae bacterium]|nr:twin-arginine translocation signal domain-containing protein [Chthonomonadaceae bacterium]